MVEHDEDTMRAADCVIDIGPGAGEHGGQLVAMGTAEDLMKNEQSVTGAYLSGRLKTVSYTHLDVYKRQEQTRALL